MAIAAQPARGRSGVCPAANRNAGRQNTLRPPPSSLCSGAGLCCSGQAESIMCCSTSIHSQEWPELLSRELALQAQHPNPHTLGAAGIWAPGRRIRGEPGRRVVDLRDDPSSNAWGALVVWLPGQGPRRCGANMGWLRTRTRWLRWVPPAKPPPCRSISRRTTASGFTPGESRMDAHRARPSRVVLRQSRRQLPL